MFSVNGHLLPAWMKVVLIIAGILFWAFILNHIHNQKILKKSGCVTEGVITVYKYHYIEYDYIIDGDTFHGRLNAKGSDAIPGDVFNTYYDCHDKSQSFIALDEKVNPN